MLRTRRPTTLQEFNQQFPPRPAGTRNRQDSGAIDDALTGRLATKACTVQDLQTVFSQLSDSELSEDSQLLLTLARNLPIALKHEPGLMDTCATRCLQAASQAPIATQEDVWLILRNAVPTLPQATAIALRDSLRDCGHHMPASVV